MSTSSQPWKTLRLYRGLLRAIRHYPSAKRQDIVIAIKEVFLKRIDFREKRTLDGQKLEKALWLGEMELQRLQTWAPTAKQMSDGKDFELKL